MHTDLEIVNTADIVASQERAMTDMQIVTAKKYPRDVALVKNEMLKTATLDVETAQTCFYTLPKRSNRDGSEGKAIQGASIRLAEIAFSCFGNLRVKTQLVGDDGKFVTVEGVCFDLEKNVAISTQVRRRVTGRDGRRYSDDMVGVTTQAAHAIARRNAILAVVPLALVKPVYDAAMKVAVGDAKSLSDRRAKVFDTFAKMGVTKAQVLEAVEAKSEADIGLDELGQLIGFYTAIKEGASSIDEIFPKKPTAPAASFKHTTSTTAPEQGGVNDGSKKDPHPAPPSHNGGAVASESAAAGAGGGEGGELPGLNPPLSTETPNARLYVLATEAGVTQREVVEWALHRKMHVDKDEEGKHFQKIAAIAPEDCEKLIRAFPSLLEMHNLKRSAAASS